MPSSPQTVPVVVLFDYLLSDTGAGLSGQRVTVVLNSTTPATSISPLTVIAQVQQSTMTDANGYWQFSLVPNTNISPANTTYTVLTPAGSYDVTLGAVGPYQSTALGTIVNVPVPLAPATSGPVTVTGNLTVTGTATAGAVQVAAGEPGIDTTGAGVLEVGGDNATTVEIGKAGVVVDANGNIAAGSLTLSSTGPYTATLPSGAATPAGVETGSFYDTGGAVVNLANYCTIDGATDQITQLQAVVDAVATGPANSRSRRFWVPGTIAISSPLLLKTAAYSGIELAGTGRPNCGLKQLTNNVSIVTAQAEDISDIHLEDLQLTYAANQSTAQTNAVAINFNKTGGIGDGWYFWRIKRIGITGAYIGIGQTGTGLIPIWAMNWEDIVFRAISHNLIRIVSTTTIGQPVSVWKRLLHINGGVAIGNAAAIVLSAAEIVCEGIDIEDWGSPLLFDISGGSPASFHGVHIERWTTGGIGGNAVLVADGPVAFSEVVVSGTPDAGGNLNLFVVNTNGKLTLERVVTNLTIANSGAWKTTRAVDGTGRFWIRNFAANVGTAVPIIPAGDTLTANAIVQLDNQFGRDLIRSRQTPTEAVLVSGIDATAGEQIGVTLTAARLVGAPLNPTVGQHLIFTFVQGGAGAFAVTWNAVFKKVWSDVGNATGARSSIEFAYDGTNWNQCAGQAPYV